MAKLPDGQFLGALEAPTSNRPVVGYDASGLGAAEERAGLTVAQSDLQRGQAQAALDASFARLGQTTQATAAQFQDTQDRLSYSAGMANFLNTKLQLDQQARDDPDYATMPQRHLAALQKAANDASAGIASPALRAQFQDGLTRIINYSMDSTLSMAHAKGVDANRGSLITQLDSLSSSAAASLDPNTVNTAASTAHDAIDAAAKAGYVSQVEAADMRAKWPKAMADKRATVLADLDPASAVKLLAPAPGATAGSPDLGNAVATAAARHGVDPEALGKIAMLESGGNAQAVNRTTQAAGPFQLMPSTAQHYGVDATDVNQSADASAQLMASNRAALVQALGRQPSGGELYLAHQQGAGAAAALIQNPDQKAVDVLTPLYGGNKDKAAAAIEQNGGTANMTAGDFTALWGKRFATAQAPAVSVGAPGGAAADASIFPKTGTWVDYLDPVKRAQLYQAAQTKLDQTSAVHRFDVEQRVKDGLAALDSGQPAPNLPSPTEVAAAYPKNPEAAAVINRTLDDARTLGGYLAKLPSMSTQDVAQATAALQPDSSQPGFAAKAHDAGIWSKAVATWTKAINDDPAGAMLSGNPDLKAQYDAATKDPSQFPAYATAALALQQRAGVPQEIQSVLPNDVALKAAQGIMADPAEAPAKLKMLEQQYGAAWPAVWRDLTTIKGGLPANYQAVGVLENERDAALLARGFADTSGAKGKTWDDLLGTKAVSDLKTTIRSDPGVQQLLSSLSRSGSSSPQVDGVLQAIESLAFSKSLYDRDPRAAQSAVDSFVGQYRFMPEGGARVPAKQYDAVRGNAAVTLAGLDENSVAIPPIFGQTGTPPASDYLNAVKAAPTWITSPKADALWLMDGQGRLVRGKGGQPLAVPFNLPAPAQPMLDFAAGGAGATGGVAP